MAKDMYALKDKITIKSGTFWDFLSSIVSEIGVDTKRAEAFGSNYSNVKAAVETQRTSISGVDEDEEGIDLVKFQHAYDLSSKVISVMNQIYSKLIGDGIVNCCGRCTDLTIHRRPAEEGRLHENYEHYDD